MQVVPLRRLFLCSNEQTVKEICAFRMRTFPVRITWSVFWTQSSPKVVYKINESANLHLSLILGKRLEKAILNRDTVIYLLRNLGYVINLKKSLLHPTQRIEFLGMIIGLVEMTVSMSQEKVEPISKRFQDILSMQEVSIKDLAKVLETLSSTTLAILPAPMYMRYLQRQQIPNLCLEIDYNSKVALNSLFKEELTWWISNLRLPNG